jgi:hypothetical protein
LPLAALKNYYLKAEDIRVRIFLGQEDRQFAGGLLDGDKRIAEIVR